ncbi:MAG: 2-dehydropantoate 2-reductase N-terminal domain-containing protein, partial [Psychromonas sp.]
MWKIIGAGAIGCLWAANLLRSGEKVQLITRKPGSANILRYQNSAKQQFSFAITTSTSFTRS